MERVAVPDWNFSVILNGTESTGIHNIVQLYFGIEHRRIIC